jgi:hypothetical protein
VIRQTWIRVRRDKQTPPKPQGRPKAKAARAGVEAAKSEAHPPTAAPPKRQSAPAPTDDDPFAGMTFAGPKKWT